MQKVLDMRVSHERRGAVACRIRREPSARDEQSPALDLRSGDRRESDRIAVVDPGSGGVPQPVSARQLGHARARARSEEYTSELQSRENLVCRLLLEKKKTPCQHKVLQRGRG